MVGRVRDFDLQPNQSVAFVQRLADEVIRQLDLKLDMAAGVRLPLPSLELAELDVKSAGRHLYLAAGHRLAEKIIALQIDMKCFLGHVKTFIGSQLGLEFG